MVRITAKLSNLASSESSSSSDSTSTAKTSSSALASSNASAQPNNPTTLKDAASIILRASSPAPLSAKQIYQRITAQKLFQTTGKTPWNSVAAQLYTDIKAKGELSRFVQPGPGLFALRDGYVEGLHVDGFSDMDGMLLDNEGSGKVEGSKKGSSMGSNNASAGTTTKKKGPGRPRKKKESDFVWHEFVPKTEAKKNASKKETKEAAEKSGGGGGGGASKSSSSGGASANASPSKSVALEKRKDHDVFRFEHKPILTPILFDIDLNANELPNRFVSHKTGTASKKTKSPQKTSTTITTTAVNAASKKRKRLLYETESDDEEDMHFGVRMRRRGREIAQREGLLVVQQDGSVKLTPASQQKPQWKDVLERGNFQNSSNAQQLQNPLTNLLEARQEHLTNLYRYMRQETQEVQHELQEMYNAFIEHRDRFYEKRNVSKETEAQNEGAAEEAPNNSTTAPSQEDVTPTPKLIPSNPYRSPMPPRRSTLASIRRQQFGSIFNNPTSNIRMPHEPSPSSQSFNDDAQVPQYVPSNLIVRAPSSTHYPIEKVFKTTVDGKTLLCSRGNCQSRRMMRSEFCIKCVLFDESQCLYVRGRHGVHDPILQNTPDVLPLPEERRW